MKRGTVDLTPGDRALLELLAQGKRDREIASAFGWHRVSVTRKVGRVLDKLGAATRCQAVAIYLRAGLCTQCIFRLSKRDPVSFKRHLTAPLNEGKIGTVARQHGGGGR